MIFSVYFGNSAAEKFYQRYCEIKDEYLGIQQDGAW